MSQLPARVFIKEEGPREGFQIATAPVPTADKIALIDALSATGASRIQVASFVSPKRVPGWADADAVVAGFAPKPLILLKEGFVATHFIQAVFRVCL